jgi:hypothetical protein
MQLSSSQSSTDPQVLLALMKARAAQAAHNDFASYVKMMAPLIVPDFKWGRHIDIICRELQRCVDQGGQRIMVFLPPRSSKSLISSRSVSVVVHGPQSCPRNPDNQP